MKRISFLALICIGLGVKSQTITTICGNGIQGYSGDGGPALSAEIQWAGDIAIDDSNNIFFCDSYNSRVRKISSKTGIITSIAGNGNFGYNGDNILADTAEIDKPLGIAFDKKGNLYFSEQLDSRIRKIDITTGIITTVAGKGTAGFGGDGGPADSALLAGPCGLTFDSTGNLFIADFSNMRIRKVDAKTNVITTVAGNGSYGYTGDGGDPKFTELNKPAEVIFDRQGNLYIADMYNDRIRMIDMKANIISTVAGDGTNSGSGGGAYGGDGGPATAAQLWLPQQMAYDSINNNLFIGDAVNNRVRKLNLSTHIITTVVGNGIAGFSGDGGLALNAELNGTYSIAIDKAGNMWIVDFNNFRIRKVTGVLGINEISPDAGITFYPNPATEYLYLALGKSYQNINISITDILGRQVFTIYSCKFNSQNVTAINISSLKEGVYLIKTRTEVGTSIAKFIKL